MITLPDTLRACRDSLRPPFDQDFARLFSDEHLLKFAQRLSELQATDGVEPVPLPIFAAECTPPLASAWEWFRQPMQQWQLASDKLSANVLAVFADALSAAGTSHVLVLLGQRLTPASITDGRAFPPTRAELLSAASLPHLSGKVLNVAGRALTKHVHRSAEAFWGDVTGSAAAINARALSVLEIILTGTTWWNVFGHFAHELVYEARVAGGHGARWSCVPLEFIGFLEPFDEEQCPSLRT